MKVGVVNSPMSLQEIEIQVAFDNLKTGMLAVMGGEIVARWVDRNRSKIKHIFCSLNECYIEFTDKKSAVEFLTMLAKHKLGSEQDLSKYATWIKPKNTSVYILNFRWE